ncbi:hypothetical protein Bca52824_096006 [Brassica carinata]|uniref:Uncharacterized protein n=1 Tax=Brassica carinata TaxID=52824 RepID=A0A8X7TJ74_BRACI|nr:hypothetical protein Bca52824_096006 [Brassica carinata]
MNERSQDPAGDDVPAAPDRPRGSFAPKARVAIKSARCRSTAFELLLPPSGEPGTIEVFERKLRPKPSGRGHACLVSQIAAPILSRIWDGSWSPRCYRTVGQNPEAKGQERLGHAVVNSSLVISPVAPSKSSR